MKNDLILIESDLKEISQMLESHKASLSHPIDSYCEDRLDESAIFRIILDGVDIGYMGIIQDELRYFHVKPVYFKYAPDALEYCISQKGIRKVNVITQDTLLVSLIAEWDYKIEKEACFFIDAER